jgi:methionyl-tRNA synthetase
MVQTFDKIVVEKGCEVGKHKSTVLDEHKNTFYVTTPIYYVTAKPHLGSLYATLLADVAARWNKLQGKQVFFLTGTDEHGQKIEQAAAKVGKKPKEFVDSFIADYKDTWEKYGIAYDYFIRTTDENHVKAVQEWLRRLRDKGDIYKATYQGWYCTPCETFVLEKDAEQKSNEGSPLCPSCGRPTIAVAEETYFFKLSAYQDKLLAFYEQNPEFIIPKERAQEVINFVKAGLKDLSISRTTVRWGIPFPDDDAHVTYVWADALNNYITAIGYAQEGKEETFKKWWPADLQVLGKDIVRFHAVFWPAFLMASDLPLPRHLLVHGWIKVDQQKMSKSLGNVIDPHALLATYGAEPVRYYLMRQIAITHDSEFSIQDLEQKIASDLADDLGNLLNRMVTLAHKYNVFDVKAPSVWAAPALTLRDECMTMVEEFSAHMQECMYHMALARLWRFINSVNAYFHTQEPWKIAANDPALFAQIISATTHGLHAIALLLWPVMPKTAELILDSIGAPFVLQQKNVERLALDLWQQSFLLRKVPVLFHKPEIKPVETKPVAAVAASTEPTITIDDFIKVQLAVGTIEQCEEVPNSDKLLKLQVNFGDKGMRQILSGIKKSYTSEELIGKQAVFVLNLTPRKMMGLESHGMLLTAQAEDGRVKAVAPWQNVPNGSILK